ncbi:hypothetical protein ES703_53226 [subsurface metagenome]
MAKLKAPLLSFGASGKLGGALVYFPWKGINAVRTYVIPANPKSGPQRYQRECFTNAVDAWHFLEYTDADRVAWNRYAGTLAAIMSGFNSMIALFIAAARTPLPWADISDIRVETPTGVGFDVLIEKSTAGHTLRVAIGVSKTHFPVHDDLVDDTDTTYSLTWAAGTANTDYYVKVEEWAAGAWHLRSGIYHVKTT